MVNINKVYETVLSILNKEQRGYLDSTEFNHLAVQVQREIFEGYFLKDLQSIGADTDFSDMDTNIAEKISFFEKTSPIAEVSTGTRANTSFFEYPSDFYRLGVVVNTEHNTIVEEISHRDLVYVLRSHLTAPTEKQAVFTREEGGIKCYPDTDTSSVNNISITYLKIPTDPNWAFDATEFASSNEAVYDSNASTNFELHPSEEHELIIRILAYAGVVVREPIVTQFAQQVDQRIQSTEA